MLYFMCFYFPVSYIWVLSYSPDEMCFYLFWTMHIVVSCCCYCYMFYWPALLFTYYCVYALCGPGFTASPPSRPPPPKSFCVTRRVVTTCSSSRTFLPGGPVVPSANMTRLILVDFTCTCTCHWVSTDRTQFIHALILLFQDSMMLRL